MGFHSNIDLKKLKGRCEGFLRLKYKDCRIIFFVDWDTKTVEVKRVGHRKNVYRDC